MQLRARYVGDNVRWHKGKVYLIVVDRDYVSVENEGGFQYDVEEFLMDWLPLKPGD